MRGTTPKSLNIIKVLSVTAAINNEMVSICLAVKWQLMQKKNKFGPIRTNDALEAK